MIDLSIVETEDRICLAMLDLAIEPGSAIKVRYKNWEDKVEIRNILPTGRMYYDTTRYHEQRQWLIEVVDLDREHGLRHFVMADILEFIKEQV